MKKLLLLLFLTGLVAQGYAEGADSTLSEKVMKEKILKDIQQNLDTKSKAIDSTIVKLDGKVNKLDSLIKNTGNPKEKMDKLVERVQVLEEKQKAIEQDELNTYEANYQSAIINLASMDREIKPLILFHTTRDFFNTLAETSNPVNYEKFEAGYGRFKAYVNRMKSHDATMKCVSDMVSATGNISFGIPLVGAYSQLVFSGMAKYVNSIGHRKRGLKKEAEQMFEVTTTLSQFTTDKNMIDQEWSGITQSLQEMQVYYDSVLDRNLEKLHVGQTDFVYEFTRESDANKRYLYLTQLREKAAAYVLNEKQQDPKNWKENIYYQLMDVQSLKMKYGDITYRIRQHIDQYSALIFKYKNNKEIGDHVVKLEDKLNQLKQTFDSAFEPTEYVHTASRMYRVM